MGFLSKFGKKGTANESNEVSENEVAAPKKPAKAKKAKKEKKAKKPLFGGKKKELTLMERMQLEESVAAASLAVVQELADDGNTAVREVDEGLLIVAITNEMLEEAALDPAGEEFGSFGQALRSETVESIALAEDLTDGVIGIIPSLETLISLDEFDFIHDVTFKWALVPFDLTDDDRLIVLESTVHLERLVELSNNPDIQLAIHNGEVVEAGQDSSDNVYVEDELEPQGVYGSMDEGVMDDEEDEFTTPDDELLDDGLDDTLDDSMDDDSLDIDDLEDDSLSLDTNSDDFSLDLEDELPSEDYDTTDSLDLADDFSDLADDMDAYEEDEITAEESKEAINRIISHGFHNTELNLSIDMEKFDDHFDSVSIAQFDTNKTDNSELQNVITKLRQDANAELNRFHQDAIQSLRSKYTSSMRDIHNKLVEALDHKDADSTYGRRFTDIENSYEDAMDDFDRQVALRVEDINTKYEESREEFGENAKREAFAVYDSRYREERNNKIDGVKEDVQASINIERDTELGDLYKDRRNVAERLFDKSTTKLLQRLQEEYQGISKQHLEMYDAFRKSMDAYLRKHFADEVLRSKAEAEKLRQSHEAERVRSEYEQMLITKSHQLDEMDRQQREHVQQMEKSHREEIKLIQSDYERRIEREQKDNENLRELVAETTTSSSKIGEQKDMEVSHRMKMYEDAIKAKDKELEFANERAEKAQKPMRYLLGAVGVVMLATGIIFGFLFGANSMQIAPPSTNNIVQEGQDFSYLHEEVSEVETFFNTFIA